jgi:hypothetical protein
VSILKTAPILAALICAFFTLNASTVCAQFAGSITVSGYRATNVEGRDSATPDNVFNPTLDLLYNWNISDPVALKFEATITPNLYQEVKSRSYVKNYLSAIGNFYLSDIADIPKPPPHPIPPAQNQPKQTEPNIPGRSDTSKPVMIIKPARTDPSQIASAKLAKISELLDSFEINKVGLNDDSIDVASDLKDSVSESVLALSEILTTQIFTEAIANVVANEVGKQKKIFSQVSIKPEHKVEIGKLLDDVLDILSGEKPQSDILPMPKPSATIETTGTISTPSSATESNDILTQALAHLQSEAGNTSVTSGENAPVMTIINSQTELKDFSSQDILLLEDIIPITKKTLATLLSIPVSFETQNNKGAYIGYSYRDIELNPRLDLYFGKTFALGTTYELTNTKFPNDTAHLNDGTVNKLRLDSRIDVTPGFVIVPELGIGFKSYDLAIQYSKLSPVKGRPLTLFTLKVTTPTSYHHIFFGGALIGFPSNSICVGVSEALTRSSDLRPYLFDSVLTQKSRIGGTVTDDEYSYDLTRESIFFIWNIVWGIRFSLDLSYENRHYANVEIGRRALRLPATNIQRDDHGPLIGLHPQ